MYHWFNNRHYIRNYDVEHWWNNSVSSRYGGTVNAAFVMSSALFIIGFIIFPIAIIIMSILGSAIAEKNEHMILISGTISLCISGVMLIICAASIMILPIAPTTPALHSLMMRIWFLVIIGTVVTIVIMVGALLNIIFHKKTNFKISFFFYFYT